ncbi:hypothetical protein HPB49_001502 [Dermacentor silvarum]|uniref:Uncharacterized protein n=1 Tax=Dermacentor silvarum TaxID=543639 RepID=A0ACB8DT08_DERSI|nr:hypothetical protein HPB49_001502 [Dermacentor silvarum]
MARLTKRGLDFDRTCQYDECHADCWLCHDIDRWSKVLHPVSLELVETEPGRLAIRSMPTNRRQCSDKDELRNAVYVFLWLPKAHRCVQRIKMEGQGMVLFSRPGTLALALAWSVNVQHLKLHGGHKTPVCAEELPKGLAGLRHLKSFDFSRFPINATMSPCVTNLLRRNASHLTAVSFSDNHMSEKSMNCLLGALQCCHLLGELTIVRNKISKENINSIAGLLRVAKSLAKLTLDQSLENNVNLFTVSEALKANTSLLELHIGPCDTRFEPLFEALTENKTLKHLDLNGCNINGGNAESLATSLRSNVGLKKLELKNAHVDTDSVVTLAHGLETNCALEMLDLRYNSVTVRAISTFCTMLQNNTTLKSAQFSEVAGTKLERFILSIRMAIDGYSRIQMTWAEPDLRMLSQVMELDSEPPAELHLNHVNELPESKIFTLLENLATNEHVRNLTVETRAERIEVAVGLYYMLAVNQTIQNLEISLALDSDDGLFDMVAKGLMKNKTVTQVRFRSWKISSRSLKSIAFMLSRNTAITKLELHLVRSMPTKHLAILSRALVKNQSVVDFTLTPAPDANRVCFRVFTAIRRNTSLLNMAVRFITHQRLDRQAAKAFEALSEKASLVPHIMKVTEQAEGEARMGVLSAKRYIQSNYFQLAAYLLLTAAAAAASHSHRASIDKHLRMTVVFRWQSGGVGASPVFPAATPPAKGAAIPVSRLPCFLASEVSG